MEPNSSETVQIEESFVTFQSGGKAQAVLTNITNLTHNLQAGTELGTVSQCEEVNPSKLNLQIDSCNVMVNQVMSQERMENRKEKLKVLINENNCALNLSEREKLHALLLEYHKVFSLEDNERGETDLVQLTIDTGDAPPQNNLLDIYHLQCSKT